MIKDGHISPRQVTAMLAIIVLGKGLDPAIVILVHYGHAATELLLLVAEGCIALLILGLLPLLQDAKKNLFDLIYDTFGPIMGGLFCSVLFLSLLLDVGVNLELDMQQIRMVFLPTTPTQVVLFLAILSMFVPVYFGIEVLGRTNLIMFTLLLGIALLLIPMTLPQIQITNFPPILGPGVPVLLKQGFLHSGFFAEYLTILMLRPSVRSYAGFRKGVLWGMGICTITGMIAMIDLQLVFPYPTDDHLFFPFVELSRILYFGRFVQHVEALFAFTWVAVALARLSILMYMLSVLAAATARATNYRRFVPLIGACLYYIALILPNLAFAIDFKDRVLEQKGIYFYGGIPLLTILVGYFKRWRKGKPGRKDQGKKGVGNEEQTGTKETLRPLHEG